LFQQLYIRWAFGFFFESSTVEGNPPSEVNFIESQTGDTGGFYTAVGSQTSTQKPTKDKVK
jgi:hypothetical protein